MSTPPPEKNSDAVRLVARESSDARRARPEPRVNGTLAYLGLGFEFLGAFLMFAAGGYGFDYMLTESGRPGFGFITGLFLGFGGGIWHLVRRANELQALEESFARERTAAAESDTISAASSSEDIQERLRRVQSGVDAAHRKLGAALDGIPDRISDRVPNGNPDQARNANSSADSGSANEGRDVPGSKDV